MALITLNISLSMIVVTTYLISYTCDEYIYICFYFTLYAAQLQNYKNDNIYFTEREREREREGLPRDRGNEINFPSLVD